MKIFTSAQVHELDKYTIENEPIKSIDLMERAAKAITQAITDSWSVNTPVIIFAGPGNNGGDALAVARMLIDKDYDVQVYLFNISNHLSEDCDINKRRLIEKRSKALIEVIQEFEPPQLEEGMLVVDGLFGTGLNKPLAGGFGSLVKYINASPAQVVSIDVPSGLMTEDNTYNVRTNIIHANLTLTLQMPKLSFLFPENQIFIGKLKVLDIRLSKQGMKKIDANYTLLEESDIRARLLKRDPFAHKGKMGNALIIAGSYGMAGASVLATKACLRVGVGKVTTHTPKRNSAILQVSVPEAIIQFDREETTFSEAVDTEGFNAVGIGPGLGTSEQTAIAIIAQLRRTQCPIVADADAINILATHRAWLQQLPKGIILTPHPKEFDRMEGHSNDSYERLMKARELAERIQGYVVLKGHHTSLCLPDGHIIINSTGNAGMATAGSGDVLTGIITGLLARGYNQENACIVGMYLHGLAGDIAARELGEESVIASDLIQNLPYAFKRLNE
ncbi:bifunctional ADP-dependent NAD(P)H-hydrate dehydratase/NAD(P)H-hydrate epimerase [Prevotella sp. P6B4]|uniref:bifunctional ADP-dependent NAD(P)H-hydrate dehydratase/NAD(P)H-hydrate epimerase n=1 Tax=Prevotella sp. P6B4 TaxID=1410614 RepID=UPI000490A53B|nr:bifunctional ADP-dependent NAD(P)H-hydrate dehydratase/NAD(P)H-hydrate epimerase [Prevotella sp. P6B4]